jgi:hypothetical protein
VVKYETVVCCHKFCCPIQDYNNGEGSEGLLLRTGIKAQKDEVPSPVGTKSWKTLNKPTKRPFATID